MSTPSPDRSLRLLLLVPRTLTPSEMEDAATKAKEAIVKNLGVDQVKITNSVSWFQAMFEQSGGWDSWIWETVTGKDYDTREPHFSGFLVYGQRLGRASAGIVDLALRANRAVLALPDGLTVQAVKSVEMLEADNMVSGWSVRTAPLGDA